MKQEQKLLIRGGHWYLFRKAEGECVTIEALDGAVSVSGDKDGAEVSIKRGMSAEYCSNAKQFYILAVQPNTVVRLTWQQ